MGANASGGGSGGGGGEGGSGALRIALPTAKTSFANTDVVIAEEKGFFKKQGLKVSLQNFGSGLKSVQAVLAGSADVGGASIEPVAAAVARHQPLKVIAPYADRLTVNLTTPASIHNVAGLKGKPVGIQDVGAFREIMVRYVLQRHGMTPSDVKYRPVASNGYLNALVAGQIDAAVLQQEQYFAVRQKNSGFHALVDLYKVQPNYFYGTYFAKDSWLKAHPDQAAAFATALMEAHRFMYDHKAETVKIATQTTGYDAKAVGQAYGVLLQRNKVFPVNSGLAQGRVDYTLNQLEKLKVISGKAPSYAVFVDAAPGKAAEHKLGREAQRGPSAASSS
jgi:ABC-type nitrate/sulfonate/bicarbonate transport system substrate-binding protein